MDRQAGYGEDAEPVSERDGERERTREGRTEGGEGMREGGRAALSGRSLVLQGATE